MDIKPSIEGSYSLYCLVYHGTHNIAFKIEMASDIDFGKNLEKLSIILEQQVADYIEWF